MLEKYLRESGLNYQREAVLEIESIENKRTNIVDFVIDSKVLLDLKAKPVVTKEDYFQMQRYLKFGNLKLGIITNFRNRYLRPIRVIRTKK